MLFNSPVFIFGFLPIVLCGYFLAGSRQNANIRLGWLAACSIFFYAFWKIEYLPILLASVGFNFLIGRRLQAQSLNYAHRGLMTLLLGVGANLALLGYFKYFDFFASNVNALVDANIPHKSLVLPLAISFFTFQQIAYLVDCYRGKAYRRPFLNYLVFVTFFPQLIAGPIVHHKEMMPQFGLPSSGFLRSKNILIGSMIFSLGLFKKVVIADGLSPVVELGFGDHTNMTVLDAWATTLAYTFQLYFDFSGYSDMALGIARMFNIKLPMNFFSPYKARSIQDFWRRWHMTLSRFLKDYLYVPLGGNRKGSVRTAINLFVTFLLGGLWHGAGWTFVIWGAIHGAALVIHRVFCYAGLWLPRPLSWLLTFTLVHFAWVFFRADSLSQAFDIISTMVGANPNAPTHTSHVVIVDEKAMQTYLLSALIVAFFLPNTAQFVRDVRHQWKSIFAAVSCGLACMAMVTSRTDVFLYFNF